MKIQIRKHRHHFQIEQHLNSWKYKKYLFSVSNSKEEKENIRGTVFLNRSLNQRLTHVDHLEDLLVQRQHIYCSHLSSKTARLELEQQILKLCDGGSFTAEEKAQVKEVLKQDQVCGSTLFYLWSRDQRRNGDQMWTMLQDLRDKSRQEFKKEGYENLLDDIPEL
ncbi:unnamed protein product [Knipowitschia caucasica]|uniref:Uncharacterized protein n=1 Tax=Knipowitschia caucasica TaxID=637954 RepID=A0AAV2ITU8_KNICA